MTLRADSLGDAKHSATNVIPFFERTTLMNRFGAVHQQYLRFSRFCWWINL